MRAVPNSCDYPLYAISVPKEVRVFKQFKYIYNAEDALKNYEIILRETRVGIDIIQDFQKMNGLLEEGIGKG